MKINKDNYEAYFLDFFEGNLSPSDRNELMAFIEQNPELKAEFEGFEIVPLRPDTDIRFSEKETLKKNNSLYQGPITTDNIEEYLVAETEGLLSDGVLKQIDQFIEQNPAFQKDRTLFSLSHLSPEPSIRFNHKETLLHKAIPVGNIDETNYEDFMIREVEGSLSPEETSGLIEFITQNPHLENDRKLFDLTRLQPDLSKVFEDKASLKRSVVPVRRIVYYALAAAASVTLLFSVVNFLDREPGNTDLAINKKKDTKKETTGSQQQVTKGTTQQIAPPLIASFDTEKPEPKKTRPKEISQDNNAIPVASITARNTDVIGTMSPLAVNEIRSRDYVEPEFMFIRTSQMHYNEYLELYYNIKLSEQIQYAQINAVDRNPEKTLFNSLASRVGDLFAFNRNKEEKTKPDLNVWTFAELGVKTYNSIAQDNVTLDLQRDEDGKVVAYNLSGDKLDFQRDIKK